MPYFQKSKGFKLKSGNKANAPFKMMGSSPAKGLMDALKGLGGLGDAKKRGLSGDKVGADAKKFGGEATDLGGKKTLTPKVSETKKEDTKPVKEEPKKHQAQIRKQKRLDKITARREGKGKEGLSSRQIRLQKEVDMSGEEFVAHRKEKRGKVFDALGKIGDQLDPDNRGLHAKKKAAEQNQENKKISNAKDKVHTERTQQLVDATNKAGAESEKLSETPKQAVSNDGASIDPDAKSSAEKIAEAKISKI